MADLSFKMTGICSGGGHVHMTVSINGGTPRNLTLPKTAFTFEQEDLTEIVPVILRSFVKESGLTNWTDIKNAIEAKTFKV